MLTYIEGTKDWPQYLNVAGRCFFFLLGMWCRSIMYCLFLSLGFTQAEAVGHHAQL